MSRRLFPSQGQRLVYHPGDRNGTALTSATGVQAIIYEDPAGEIPADILDSTGDPIDDSTVTVGSDSLLPLFYGPDNDEGLVWMKLAGSTTEPVPLEPSDNVFTVSVGRVVIDQTITVPVISNAGTEEDVILDFRFPPSVDDANLNEAVAAYFSTNPSVLLSANNLSDIADKLAGRANLGLGNASTKDVGTTANTVAAGDDVRFTGSRNPLAHKTTHAAGGSDALSPADIGAPTNAQFTSLTSRVVVVEGDLGHPRPPTAHKATHATGGTDPLIPSDIGAITSTQADAKVATETTARTAADTTLSNRIVPLEADLGGPRTPTNHASRHATGGADPITPASIGAVSQSQVDTAINTAVSGEASTRASADTTLSNRVTVVESDLGVARPPTAHATSHAIGGTDLLTPAAIGAATPASVTTAVAAETTARTTADTALSSRVAVVEADLGHARPPNAHKTTHATGGSDALTAADIGAETGGAVAAHVAATDPHGDRAYADSLIGGLDAATLDSLVALSNALGTVPANGTSTGGSNSITFDATMPAAFVVGVPITGPGVPTNTYIGTIPDTTHVTLSSSSSSNVSVNAGSGSGHGTFEVPNTDLGSQLAAKMDKASNLSDVSSVSAARTNLGLGGAALLAVGTTAGTVAAGNDARLTDTRTPTDATVTNAKVASAAGITLAKLEQIAETQLVGRATGAGTGVPTVLSATTVRTLLGLGGAAVLNVGTATGTVAAGDDSRLTDARNPIAGSVTNTAVSSTAAIALSKLATIANNTVVGNVSGVTAVPGPLTNTQVKSFLGIGTSDVSGLGTAAVKNVPASGNATGTDVVLASDTRLSDSRTPTGSISSGSLAGSTYPNPTIANGTVTGAMIASAIVDPVAGTAGLRTLGTGAQQAVAGNDARLATSGAGSLFAVKANNLSDVANPATARANLGLAGAATLSVGTTTGTVAAGDDARLTNARTPTTHASTHATAGSDPISASSIGAAPTAAGVPTGGATGQVLAKTSSSDYATGWTSVSSSGLPTMADKTILGNNSGTVTTPTALDATAARTVMDVPSNTTFTAYQQSVGGNTTYPGLIGDMSAVDSSLGGLKGIFDQHDDLGTDPIVQHSGTLSANTITNTTTPFPAEFDVGNQILSVGATPTTITSKIPPYTYIGSRSLDGKTLTLVNVPLGVVAQTGITNGTTNVIVRDLTTAGQLVHGMNVGAQVGWNPYTGTIALRSYPQALPGGTNPAQSGNVELRCQAGKVFARSYEFQTWQQLFPLAPYRPIRSFLIAPVTDTTNSWTTFSTTSTEFLAGLRHRAFIPLDGATTARLICDYLVTPAASTSGAKLVVQFALVATSPGGPTSNTNWQDLGENSPSSPIELDITTGGNGAVIGNWGNLDLDAITLAASESGNRVDHILIRIQGRATTAPGSVAFGNIRLELR